MRRHGGFTLMEMLVVLGIISVLAGLLVSGIVVARRQARKNTTRMMMENIALALERYSGDYGQYPDGSGNEASAEILYRALAEKSGFGPYLKGLGDRQVGDTDGDGARELLDGWGQPIRFTDGRYLPDDRDYELRSAGPDGAWNTGDDLVK